MRDANASLRSKPLLPDPALHPVAAAGCTVAVLAVFAAAVAVPLATYTTALAMFGLAHVGSELRYVDHRFGGRLHGGLVLWLGCGLAAAVAVRLFAMAGVLPYGGAIILELTVVAAMTAATFVGMRRFRAVAAGLAALLFASAVLAPLPTFLFLAVAHNLTPLAFLADALSGRERRRVLAIMMLGFVAVPLLIASGMPHALLARAGVLAPELSVFAAGSLADNLGAYVPPSYVAAPWAVNVFSAAVFAQCMHYATVILILPRLIGEGRARQPILPWPAAGRFVAILAGLALALVVGFAFDYGSARKVYALAALVHGWIEIPILVLALDRTGVAAATANPMPRG